MHAGHVPRRFQHQAQILAVQFSHQLPGAYWRIGERDLVFLIPRKDRNVLDFLQNQRLPQLLISNNMRGILSNPVDDIINIHKAYQQTTVLYELREYLPEDVPLHLYADHMILHIANILHQRHSLRDFYYPILLMIRDYDRLHHTDFISTLYEYLTYIDNPSLIATHLNIHKNTLYYRINKLKELFPMDLNDGKLRLKLQLSMEIMRLEHEFKEED